MDNQNKNQNQNYANFSGNNPPEGMEYPGDTAKMTHGQLNSMLPGALENVLKMTNGQLAPISEDAARLLLQEETRKTEQSLSAQEKKSKKLLKVVIVVAVILCVAGLAFALIMQLQNHDTSSGSQAGQTPLASTPNPEEENELVATNGKLEKL